SEDRSVAQALRRAQPAAESGAVRLGDGDAELLHQSGGAQAAEGQAIAAGEGQGRAAGAVRQAATAPLTFRELPPRRCCRLVEYDQALTETVFRRLGGSPLPAAGFRALLAERADAAARLPVRRDAGDAPAFRARFDEDQGGVVHEVWSIL